MESNQSTQRPQKRWQIADELAKRNGLHSTIFFGNGKYTGEWKDNLRHFKGLQEFNDGSVYEGNWECDKACGHGLFYSPFDPLKPPHPSMKVIEQNQLFLRYDGNWKDNELSGYGIYYYDDGSRYEGYWMHNDRHGFGAMYYTNGEIYCGMWANDIREGKGTLFKPDGTILQGMFEQDLPHGQCVYFTPAKKRMYTGEWFEGIPKCGVYEETEGPFPNLEDELGRNRDSLPPEYLQRKLREDEDPPPEIVPLLLKDIDGVILEAQRQAREDYLKRRYPHLSLQQIRDILDSGRDIEEFGLGEERGGPRHRRGGGRSQFVQGRKGKTGRQTAQTRKVQNSGDLQINFEGEGVVRTLDERTSKTIDTPFGPM
ncbi:putative MORN motif protein [Blattamonas nauphoetae]|uniref:MORN repeat-containing protein 3 n=1 Tax=Blattamonas nauphoetae TaxID=2049346 RepID=A0ABQ9Y1W7_9EUKA|nr:putative MORN motif protein [Blattamonas nauphoetae]